MNEDFQLLVRAYNAGFKYGQRPVSPIIELIAERITVFNKKWRAFSGGYRDGLMQLEIRSLCSELMDDTKRNA